MRIVEKKVKENNAYETKLEEDLTINEALILVAVCAAKEHAVADSNQSGEAKQIAVLANEHPIFSDLSDSIEPCVNRFMNMTKQADTTKYVSAAANTLKQKHKETALKWAAMILMPDGVLTETRKNILDKYALLLNIGDNAAQDILVQASQVA
jgi:hypothetical protein